MTPRHNVLADMKKIDLAKLVNKSHRQSLEAGGWECAKFAERLSREAECLVTKSNMDNLKTFTESLFGWKWKWKLSTQGETSAKHLKKRLDVLEEFVVRIAKELGVRHP